MAYQVIARKWRPQRFGDVVGQQPVTRTLANALTSNRLAHAFVFAGPRGVGKTTTARILARALSCVKGPTPDPCGECDACVEIAEGRDIDVLEIDAATHTQVDNVREVIISGLAIAPVRNRYKVFIIDEVHQLSSASFNALLKSIEEPPAHVVFMMATTELEKIPETVLSRSQVYEFRTIGTKAIAEHLRRIADAEKITVGDDSLQLIARDAEGSMRDAQSKLDQVIAFTGATVAVEDVAAVLGLVGRDLLLDAIQAVADEDGSAAFALAARAVEMGYDLRGVVHELQRVVRDLLVLSVDQSRITDPEIAAEGERDRLKTLAGQFSREDLLRAFDLLARAETDIRGAAEPRYHLEMLLLRWIHLRKLVPIEELIAGAAAGGGTSAARRPTAARPAPPRAATSAPGSSQTAPSTARSSTAPPAAAPSSSTAPPVTAPSLAAPPATAPSSAARAMSVKPDQASISQPGSGSGDSGLRDALLTEIRKVKVVLYQTVVAQAQRIDVSGDRIAFSFSSNQRALRDQLEQNRGWLESVAQQVSGRKITVSSALIGAADGRDAKTGATETPADPAADKKSALREQALADSGVQALLEVFPAEIRDVEEM